MKKENKEKEMIEIKKLYLVQFEKFENKVFFAFLSLSITLLILHLTEDISFWWGLGLMLVVTLILDSVLQGWRINSFHKLIKQINEDKLHEKLK